MANIRFIDALKVGAYQGPQGETGEQGPVGPQGPSGSNFPFTGSAEISGSLNVDGSITGSFFVGDGSGLTNVPNNKIFSNIASWETSIQEGTSFSEGDRVFIQDTKFTYRVANPSSTDYHLTLLSGSGNDLKLYAIPEDSKIRMSQLGLTAAQSTRDPNAPNIEPELRRIMENGDLTGIDILIVDGLYNIEVVSGAYFNNLKAIVSSDFDTLSHGDQASDGFVFLNSHTQSVLYATNDGFELGSRSNQSIFKFQGSTHNHTTFTIGGLLFADYADEIIIFTPEFEYVTATNSSGNTLTQNLGKHFTSSTYTDFGLDVTSSNSYGITDSPIPDLTGLELTTDPGFDVIQNVELDNFNVVKCNFKTHGGQAIEIRKADNWNIDKCEFSEQKTALYLLNDADFGSYIGNKGEMGYKSFGNNYKTTALYTSSDGTAYSPTGIQGDFIKTVASSDLTGPKYCTISHNRFVNEFRDGPDGTGGFQGWTFSDNYFEVAVAALDIKLRIDGNDYDDTIEDYAAKQGDARYQGIIFSNNICVGCGLIVSTDWENGPLINYDGVDNNGDGNFVDDVFSRDQHIRDIIASSNVFFPKIGKSDIAYSFKNGSRFTSTGDAVVSLSHVLGGYWDPNSGTLPENSEIGQYYIISGSGDSGTFDGIGDPGGLEDGDTIFPTKTSASTTDASEWAYDSNGSSFWGMQYFSPAGDEIESASFTSLGIENLIYDARGVNSVSTNTVKGSHIHFSRLHVEDTIMEFSGQDFKISGHVIVNKPNKATYRESAGLSASPSSVDLFQIKSFDRLPTKNLSFDVTVEYEEGQAGAMFRILSPSSTPLDGLYIDGSCRNNAGEVIDFAGDCKNVYLGTKSGLTIEPTGSSRAFNLGNVEVDGFWVGDFKYSGSNTLITSGDIEKLIETNLFSLKSSKGRSLTVDSGEITATHNVHLVKSEVSGSADTITSILGGDTGDILTLSPYRGNEVITITTSILNVTLNDNTESVTLIKKADGEYHLL